MLIIIVIITLIAVVAVVYIFFSIFCGYKEKFKITNEKIIKPKRVIVSFTTLPSRTENVKKVINSILANTIQPDAIYINVPVISKKENKKYEIDPNILKSEKVIVNVSDTDYGPITKLYPTLLEETDPETIIICIDDDKEYDERLIEHLLKASQKYPESCICISGWNYINLKLIALPLVFSSIDGIVKKVDILQCYNGVLYKRKFFNDSFGDNISLENCNTTDDILISKYLKSENVEILSIPSNIKNKNINNNFFHSLGLTNLSNNNWIKCINEELL